MSKKIFYILGSIFFLFLAVSLPLAFGFGKTGKNTTILGQDFSLLNKEQIISKLDTTFPLPENFIVTYDNRNFEIPLASVSASIDYSKTASNLLFRRLNQGVTRYFVSFFQPKDFVLTLNINESQLNQIIDDISAQIDTPFIPSELTLDSNRTVVVKNGELGRQVDQQQLANLIVQSLVNYQLYPLSIPTNSLGSLPDPSTISQSIERANLIKTQQLILRSADQNINLTGNDLISFIGFGSDCHQDKINLYVNNLSTSLNHPPVDAVFKFENNKVLEFKSAKSGRALVTDELGRLICQAISANNFSPIELTFKLTEPQIQNDEVNDLGIKELLGKGTSTFKHSTAIRNFNVEKGASIVNRILVAPGETFSFIKNLGDVSLEAGFKKAYVIRAGKTELDVGGGICQVSTTLFRAMLNAGLDITERKNHAYRVRYYEEDMPPGYDATVFIPSPDLKFINDTSHYLLIQNTYDGNEKRLTYEIYGTSDGRVAEITNYRQWDASPAPPDVYIDDPTLPLGKVVQDEQRIPGLKTAFDWKVTRDGSVIHQKTFQSNFVPWAAVFRRGTGQ